MRTLLVGPAILEFGWNLCAYNPYARAKARRYDYVVVCCPPGEEYIWEFADEFFHVNKPNRADRWLVKNGRPIKAPKQLLTRFPKADRIVPCVDTCTKGSREYRKFGDIVPEKTVVIHARATIKYHQNYRNWPVENFVNLVKLWPEYNFVSIGTQANHIPGTVDKRNIPLKDLCDLMASSCLVIGPSSGPMHLASLCKTPHIVWTKKTKDKAIKATNRVRYERLWNPYRTRVVVVDKYGWQPSYKSINLAMRKILEK